MIQAHLSDSVHWYIDEVTSRVVAKTGIPTDRFHIGKIILQSFTDDPNFVIQIDGGTGESETNGSLLKRSIQCAISFKKMGLKQTDVMVLMAPNHLDLAVPFYAGLYLGIIVAPVDRTLKISELEYTFTMCKPSIVLCQSEKRSDVEAALKATDLNAKIFTFDRDDRRTCFADLLKANDEDIESFKAEDFNAEESVGFILPTSGSTGFPKGAAITYKTWMITAPHIWARHLKFPSPTRSWMVLSPLQWLTATLQFIISPIMKYTRLQTSKAITIDHTRNLINTYKPTATILSSTMMTQFLKPNERQIDLTCFELIMIGGSAVHKETLKQIKIASPETVMINAYGMTEMTTIAFQGDSPIGSCGKPTGIYQYRLVNLETKVDIEEPNVNGELWVKGPGMFKLVNLETKVDIEEPNVNGELWVKGPGMFKEYYNNPEATKEAFAEDRWLKTGDMFYRDENWNYFFVERIKLLMKYKHYQISPVEIEGVIREHPGVLDVAVTSLPDSECGDLPVACVIPKPGFSPTAQEIKDLVKEKLSDAKQLRGGVIFMTAFPMTATAKINRMKLNDIVREMKTE